MQVITQSPRYLDSGIDTEYVTSLLVELRSDPLSHTPPSSPKTFGKGTTLGTLHYGNSTDSFTIPDRVLAHIKVVATTKLRRQESFTVTWTNPGGAGAARTTLWMQPAIPLRFDFDSAEPETLDADYLRQLADAASTTQGMTLEWDEAETRAPARLKAA